MALFGIFGRSTPAVPATPAAEEASPVTIPSALTIAPSDPTKRAQTNYAASILSYVSYEKNEAKVRQTLSGLGFTDIKLYGWDEKGVTQAIVARKGDVVTVTFRGTQGKADIMADLPATNSERDPDLSGSEVQGTAFDGSEVHRGFRDALAELWDPDEHGRNGERLKAAGHKALLATLQEEAKVAGTQFLFTGHSLGGGKATLAAAYTSLQNPANSSRRFMKENVASVVTFGSPKVGNDKFVAAYDKALGAVTFPFEHNDDFVRAMPPGLGYQHVGSSNLLKLGAATGAAGRLDSHRMHYYVEQMEREAAKEIAATSRPVAALRPRFADVFVAG